MKKIIFENVRIILMAAIFSLGLGVAFAWTGPTTPPPPTGTNVPAPINASAIGQAKEGNLLITNSGGLANGLIVANGNVGIGMVSPDAKLEIAGGIKVANDSGTCNQSKAGTIRFTGAVFEGCDGTVWRSLSTPANNTPATVTCTPDSPLTQTLSCPPGMIGNSVTQTRTSTCPAGATSPNTSAWFPATNSNCVAPPLTWSGNVGQMNWDTAKAYCENPANGYLRLPTLDELNSALLKQFPSGTNQGFQDGEAYWSNTNNGTLASLSYYSSSNGHIVNSETSKAGVTSVRCVR